MTKKFLIYSVVAAQIAVSCSTNDKPSTTADASLAAQIAEISGKPYSALTPDQQKVKLESDANDMLLKMDKFKTIGATSALENLGNLLNTNSIDFLSGKNNNGLTDLLQVSDTYGVYTWNNSMGKFVKTSSTSELKFIFPSKDGSTTNDAILSISSTPSTIKDKITDTPGAYVQDPNTGEYTQQPSIDDNIYLPSAANATLTINGVSSATIATTAKYADGTTTPTEGTYKVTLAEGYVLDMSAVKGTANTAKALLTYNGSTLIDLANDYSGNVDSMIKDSNSGVNLGNGNSYIKLMDNFAITATVDAQGMKTDQDAIDKNYVYPDYSDGSAYYTAVNTYNQNVSVATATAQNKNIKSFLVSRKDGTKIAQVFIRSEKGDSYSSYDGFTTQEYKQVQYLRFNDNTEVAFDVYFSAGFDDFNQKFQDFINAF